MKKEDLKKEITQEQFTTALDKQQPDSPFLISWMKKYDETKFPLVDFPFGQKKLCLTPEIHKQSCINLIKLAEIGQLSELQQKLIPIFEQIESCKFECEGGNLESNAAYINLKKLFQI